MSKRRLSREPLSLFPDTPRFCTKCETFQSPAAFGKGTQGRGGNKDGLLSWCRVCMREKNRVLSKIGHSRRRYKYKLEPEDFAALIALQDNLCANQACRADLGIGRNRHVDHCHTTGVVRGLLCRGCNHALGHTLDNPAVLRGLADYIERHGQR